MFPTKGCVLAQVGYSLCDSKPNQKDHEAASELALRLLGERVGRADGEADINAKSALQELVQGKGHPAPVYRIIEQSGNAHAPYFVAEVEVGGEVVGRGSGHRKSAAEQAAARAALAELA